MPPVRVMQVVIFFNGAAVEKRIFPVYAPGYVLLGSIDCPLRSDLRGNAKVVAASSHGHVAFLWPADPCAAGLDFESR
ncbi:hypothetical protein C7J99_12940 [Brevibacillus brevis]|nr:hypothetical protein C7J99_12940 [Brevibacillus brevis]